MLTSNCTTSTSAARSAATKIERAIAALRDAEEIAFDHWGDADEFDAGVLFFSAHRALEAVQARVRKLSAHANEADGRWPI